MPRPNPEREIRLLAVRTLPGANYWSPGPVTRVDVAAGAYDEISSADLPDVTESLLRALPGLVEHRCSIGERGGFVARLERGTYAPHIIEHIALELQAAIGHDVGFGRARGGGAPGVYTVVFEHRHARVGARAGELAVNMVRDAFAGTLVDSQGALVELAAIEREPDEPLPRATVACAVTGGTLRGCVARALRSGSAIGPPLDRSEAQIVEVPPGTLLETGLPYARSRVAVITDTRVDDLPDRYREPEVLCHLLSAVAEAVPKDGWVVLPADAPGLRERVAEAGRSIALFSGEPPGVEHDGSTPFAFVRGGRIVVRLEGTDRIVTPSTLSPGGAARAAAVLTSLLLADADRRQDPRSARY